jgi:hypothetical protein
MSTTKESGFEGPLPSSIKPDGFHCYRRAGCDRQELCEGEGECLGADPPLADTLNRERFDENAKTESLGDDPPLANASSRSLFDEIAGIVRVLTYADMIEFAGGLWNSRGVGEVSVGTLPKMLHAWAKQRESGVDKKFFPIDTAPKDRPILAFMLGRWRTARWKSNHPHKRPVPFWSADDLRVTVSREHQPKWWAELPPSPPEADA